MASRFRIFVKKRGTRRTGARWMATVIEAILAIALIAIGTYGIYWLLERVFWTEGPSASWWPWAVMIIPVSVVGYGATSLFQLLWRSAVSTERRAAVVQR